MSKKIKLGKFEITEEEFERQVAEANERGRKFFAEAPKALNAKYDRSTKRLVLDLQNGSTLIVPTENIQGLRGGAAEDLEEVELLLENTTLHWEKLDVDFYVSDLMRGVFGTPKWMERLNANTEVENKPQKRVA